MECKFCNKILSSMSSLNYHQKTTKYCLKKQGKLENLQTNFKCNYCDIMFTTKNVLNYHTSICNKQLIEKDKLIDKLRNELTEKEKDKLIDKIKTESEINILKTQMEIYKTDHECIQEIAKQPKINNKFINLAPLNLTANDIKTVIGEKFTKEYFLEGQKGLAELTYNHLLLDSNKKSKYACTDVSRNTFVYKTSNGEIKKDYNAVNITSLISKDAIEKSKQLNEEITLATDDFDVKHRYVKKLCEIKNITKNNSKYAKRLSELTSQDNNILISDIEKYARENVPDRMDNLLTIDDEYIEKQVENFTIEHVKNTDSLIQYALDYPLKNRIIYPNTPTSIVIYKDKNNTVIVENAEILCWKVIKSFEKKYIELYEIYEDKLFDETEEDNEEHTILLTDTQENHRQIMNTINNVNEDFMIEFVDEICIQSRIIK